MAEKVDQDVREAAAQWSWLTDMWESPEYDAADMLAKAFARMKAAGRQQGLREAAEVAQGVLYNVFEESLGDEVKAAIEALLSEKPA